MIDNWPSITAGNYTLNVPDVQVPELTVLFSFPLILESSVESKLGIRLPLPPFLHVTGVIGDL